MSNFISGPERLEGEPVASRLFRITAHSTSARAREMSFACQWFVTRRLSCFMIVEEQEFAEAALERFGVKVSFDAAAVTNGNDARFLADHHDERVRFLAQAERGAMAHSERAIEIDPLAHGKSAGRGQHAVVA